MSRRRFFLGAAALAGAGLAVSGCGGIAPPPPGLAVAPTGPSVRARERALERPGQRVTRANLDAVVGPVDLGGPVVSTWSYGGEVPGQVIRATKGDLLVVQLRNRLPDPTTVHWHGIAIDNAMDGIPDVTQPAIAPDGTFEYRFTVPDAGTHWFHPHLGTQLDRGLYAPLIVEDPADPADYDQELVLVFDDWLDGTGRTPPQVLANLQANGMGAMGMGGAPMPHSQLLGGDAGDVNYPYYLANGRVPAAPPSFTAKAGQRVRLRLLNAGADTAFRVGAPGLPMLITHSDGYPVAPTAARAVLLGMGERLDAIITMPEHPVPLLGLAEGKNGLAQLVLSPGQGGRLDTAAAAAALTTEPVTWTTNLTAAPQVTLPTRAPDLTHELKLGGPSAGYTWTINGETYDPRRGMPVHQGQRVRLRYTNSTMMFHPMHLHGHTFQIHRTNGRIGPRKDTAIVLPNQTLEVDFDADNPGQWLTHCHNVYHGEAGMMTIVSYRA